MVESPPTDPLVAMGRGYLGLYPVIEHPPRPLIIGAMRPAIFLCVRQVAPDSGARPQGDPIGITAAEHLRAGPVDAPIRRRGDIGANPGLGGHPDRGYAPLRNLGACALDRYG